MESYRTEEEQVEALRKWWDENGKSTIAAIVVALGIGFGWQGWQDYRQGQAETASTVYENMLAAFAGGEDGEPSAAQITSGRHLANQLKTEFAGSTYAQFAALHLARLAVGEGDLAAAEEELRWVLKAGPAAEIEGLVQLRLARVMAAAGDTDGALAILASESEGFEAAYAEARGNIYLQRGERDAAREEYQRAAAAGAMAGRGGTGSLELKLESLNPQPPRELAALTPVSGDAGADESAPAEALPVTPAGPVAEPVETVAGEG